MQPPLRRLLLYSNCALRHTAADSHVHRSMVQRGLATASTSHMESIKSLRERSGAPIGEVKAALVEADWEPEKAFQHLRKKGLAAAVKKASRRAAEGLVGLATQERAAVLVEVNSETDFVARTDEFRGFVSAVAQAALQAPDSGDTELSGDALEDLQLADGHRAGDAAQQVAGLLRENIKLRRGHRLACPSGVVGHYLHISPAPGLGRMAALVALEPQSQAQPLPFEHIPAAQALGKQIAMHITAARPMYLDSASVPESIIEGERDVLRQQAAKSNKPAAIIDKMIEGRLKKYFEEVCLLHQKYVMDDMLQVRDILQRHKPAPLKITSFLRFQCGEGLDEASAADFATEVAQAVHAA